MISIVRSHVDERRGKVSVILDWVGLRFDVTSCLVDEIDLLSRNKKAGVVNSEGDGVGLDFVKDEKDRMGCQLSEVNIGT